MRYGVIDIGSNAVRLALRDNASHSGALKTWREPLRLWTDSFSEGQISEEKILELERLFEKFHARFQDYGVDKYKAVATSALRDAENCDDVIRRVFEHSQLKIDLIDGVEESRLVHSAVSKSVQLKGSRSLIIDIGGGSVEVIISEGEKIQFVQSLCLGTVRLLQKIKNEKDPQKYLAKKIRKKIDKTLDGYQDFFVDSQIPVIFIGTGGNLKSIEKLTIEIFKDMKKGFLSFERIQHLEELLFSMSYNERVKKLNLRADRADVILPAIVTVRELMSYFQLETLEVPKVGLKEGLMVNFDQLETRSFDHRFRSE